MKIDKQKQSLQIGIRSLRQEVTNITIVHKKIDRFQLVSNLTRCKEKTEKSYYLAYFNNETMDFNCHPYKKLKTFHSQEIDLHHCLGSILGRDLGGAAWDSW